MATDHPTTSAQLALVFSQEQWKPVVGWEQYYEVSNLGRVRSLDQVKLSSDRKRRVGPSYVIKGRLIRLHHRGSTRASAYLRVSLTRNKRESNVLVHTLVLEAFVGPRPQGYVANHKNGQKEDNRVENLEWVTYGRNNQHALETGLRRAYGEDSHFVKYTTEQVLLMRRLYKEGLRVFEIAQQVNIPWVSVWYIVHRRRWKHLPEE